MIETSKMPPAAEATAERAKIEILPDPPPYSFAYRITGTLGQVLYELNYFFIEYPADGYGSACSGIKYHADSHAYVARVTRSKSCE